MNAGHCSKTVFTVLLNDLFANLPLWLCVSGPMSSPRNLTIYNHTAVSVWLSWEPPLEPNGLVIQYGFRVQDLITHVVTHRVLLISHLKSCSITTTAHTPPHTSLLLSKTTHFCPDRGTNFTPEVAPGNITGSVLHLWLIQ